MSSKDDVEFDEESDSSSDEDSETSSDEESNSSSDEDSEILRNLPRAYAHSHGRQCNGCENDGYGIPHDRVYWSGGDWISAKEVIESHFDDQQIFQEDGLDEVVMEPILDDASCMQALHLCDVAENITSEQVKQFATMIWKFRDFVPTRVNNRLMQLAIARTNDMRLLRELLGMCEDANYEININDKLGEGFGMKCLRGESSWGRNETIFEEAADNQNFEKMQLLLRYGALPPKEDRMDRFAYHMQLYDGWVASRLTKSASKC
jgi:hypothetical protein